jgi:hypothetical protein
MLIHKHCLKPLVAISGSPKEDSIVERKLLQQLIRIENPDKPVYRIFPLWYLEETIRLHQLVLVSPSLWEDPFEVIGNTIAVNFSNDDQRKQEIINQSLPPVYAQCWSMTSESDTLLRAYSRVVKDPQFRRNICPRDEGVKVRSTPRKLLKPLVAGVPSGPVASCFIGSVWYLERDKLLQAIAKTISKHGLDIFEKNKQKQAELLLMKRAAFLHEAEVRLIAIIHHETTSTNGVFKISIDPNTVFDEITFDPRLETFQRKEREASFRDLGYTGQFGESSLYQKVLLQIIIAKSSEDK